MRKWQIRTGLQATRTIGVTSMILLLSNGMAPTQAGAQTPAQAVTASLPQDIRVMQRIVSTALAEVQPPEVPEASAESDDEASGYAYAVGGQGAFVWSRSGRSGRITHFGGRDISGFYMQGYGYLFTVKWRVAGQFGDDDVARVQLAELDTLAYEARRAAAAAQEAESRAADEAGEALEAERRQLEERQQAWRQWSARYRDRLAEELRGVIAQYGSTLNRAQPDESITFIADFGGGLSETVTASARRGELTGAGREQNLAAVRLAKGEVEVSQSLRTELKIMAAIIDSSLQRESMSGITIAYADGAWHAGGDSDYQYVPGYGVLFRKSARLNLATRVIQEVAPSRARAGSDVTPGSLRQRIDKSTEEQREAYSEHLAGLKRSTAEILATYGPTLTRMEADEWVGVYYDVGSAAGLLEGGITNFLVQSRMDDIRQAASQTDAASWLFGRLVTNERQE